MLNKSYSNLDLIQMQVNALFVHNANSRLLRINEPDPTEPAPRFFLARTAVGNLWRTRHDLPAELAAALEQLAAAEPINPDLPELPLHAAEYRKLLEQHAPIRNENSGPMYTLPELAVPETALTITHENAALLQAHFSWLVTTFADYAPVVVVVADGAAVAACFSSRLTAQVGAAGVYTEAHYRGRGYAADVVRGWAAEFRASGRLPLYDTSWTNLASQAVARKLGAVQYAAEFSLT